MAGYLPPAGWTQPDARGNVQFTKHHPDGRGRRLDDRAPEREGFECFFIATGPDYTRWTYRPIDTPVQQARLVILDLQRSLASLDLGLNVLRNLTPVTQAQFSQNERAIADVVNAKNTIVDMQDSLLADLPADVREQVVRRSRIGADHLRGR